MKKTKETTKLTINYYSNSITFTHKMLDFNMKCDKYGHQFYYIEYVSKNHFLKELKLFLASNYNIYVYENKLSIEWNDPYTFDRILQDNQIDFNEMELNIVKRYEIN